MVCRNAQSSRCWGAIPFLFWPVLRYSPKTICSFPKRPHLECLLTPPLPQHHVLYEPMQGEYLFAQKEKIAAQIKMTKDNLAMLEARLQLDDELLLLHPITKALNELEGRVANKERDIQRLNEQKRVLVKEFDDAVSTWRSKYLESTEAGSKPERAPETEPKTTKLESLDKVKASKVQPPQQKNKQEISDLQNQISLLRKKIVSIEGQDCRKQPIVEVGLDILARKIELSKPRGERDEAIIEQGNKAAHNGTALADARRLLLRRAKRDEEEWTWYEEEYGASPDVVSKIGSDSPKALEILDWRFSIRSFDTVRVGLLEDFEILFVKVAGALKSGKSTHNKAADMNLFLETDTGKQIYDKMKTLYLAARKYRKTFRS